MLKSLNFDDEDYYCLVQCGCGRKYKPENMFICYVCKEIKCKFCIIIEGQKLQCKAGCTNQFVSDSKTKNIKFCCSNCLECPLCFTPLVRKNSVDKFYLSCPSCYWNSLKAHIYKGKKEDFEKYIQRMNEETCNGFLKKMYNNILNKLSNDPLIANRKKKQLDLEERNKQSYNEIVQKAMEEDEQNIDNFEKKINLENETEEKKAIGKCEYIDEYINNDDNKYITLKIINKLLPCYNDYNQNFNSLEEVQKAFNTNDLSLNAMTDLEQRHNNPILQNTSILSQYPKFCDLIPKITLFNKKCKKCGKIIVEEVEDNQPKKLEDRINHSFIRQLPIVYINKIDLEQSFIRLRFIMLNFFDAINISFKEAPLNTNSAKIIMPEGKFNFNEKTIKDTFCSKYKNFLVDFKFDESYKPELVSNTSHIIRFIVCAEFNRSAETSNEQTVEPTNVIEYVNEIKFKIK